MPTMDLVRVAKRPAPSGEDLEEERRRLALMQRQVAHLRDEVLRMKHEDFQQRYDAVRLMHLMLSRMHIVRAPQATPHIHVNPQVLANPEVLESGMGSLPHGTAGVKPLSLTGGAAPNTHDEMLVSNTAFGSFDAMDSSPIPPFSDAAADMFRVREVVTLPSGNTAELPQPGTVHQPQAGVKVPGTPTFDLPMSAATAAALPDGGLPASTLLEQLPHIPYMAAKDLPPPGTAQRAQIEAAIDWYLDKLSLTSGQVQIPAQTPVQMPIQAPASMPRAVHKTIEDRTLSR